MLISRQVLTLCIFQIGLSGENQKSAVDELGQHRQRGTRCSIKTFERNPRPIQLEK